MSRNQQNRKKEERTMLLLLVNLPQKDLSSEKGIHAYITFLQLDQQLLVHLILSLNHLQQMYNNHVLISDYFGLGKC